MSSHHCIICGRPLKTPESVLRGMGPKCAAKVAFSDKADTASMGGDFLSIPITQGLVCKRALDGSAMTNIPRLITRHSPTGFNFGYTGSGPADLALNTVEAMLRHMGHNGPKATSWTGGSPAHFEATDKIYQDFKAKVIATIDQHGGGIVSYETMQAVIQELLGETVATPKEIELTPLEIALAAIEGK